MDPAPLLSLRSFTVRYRPAGGGAALTAVAGVDLDVFPGEVLGLIGESGCGKTSLVRAAFGLVPRAGGEVRLCGLDPARLAGAERVRLRSAAQLLFQDPGSALNPGLRVAEVLAESLRVHRPGLDRAARAAAVDAALAGVGLAHRREARPHELSGGEKRRVTLAQLLLTKPRLVAADEPTAGLDAARKAEIIDLLLAGVGPGSGLLLISHDLPLVLYACTRVVVMERGRLVDSFTPSTLRDGPRHPLTVALLDAAGMGPGAAPEAREGPGTSVSP